MFLLNGSIVIQKLSNSVLISESCCVQLLFFVEVDDDVQLKVAHAKSNPSLEIQYLHIESQILRRTQCTQSTDDDVYK